MCLNREHRYRLTIKVDEHEFDLVVYARHMTEAVSKADGYAFKAYPLANFVTFTVLHARYATEDVALEHGVIIPEELRKLGVIIPEELRKLG